MGECYGHKIGMHYLVEWKSNTKYLKGTISTLTRGPIFTQLITFCKSCYIKLLILTFNK